MEAEVGYTLAFTTGLLGSMHCIGMCGGLVSAFFLKIGARGGIFPYISYHSARIMVYTLLGVIIASLGQALERSSAFGEIQVIMLLFAGLLIIFMGLDMLGVLPWRLPYDRVPVTRMKKLYKRVMDRGPVVGSFMGGALNGFIPCGLLYAVLISAAALGSSARGGLLLASFGAGTLPAMLSVSFVLGKIGTHARGLFFKMAAVVIMVMGARTLYTAFQLYVNLEVPGYKCH